MAKSKVTQDDEKKLDEKETLEFKAQLSLDTPLPGVATKTIRYELGKEGTTEVVRLARAQQIRKQLGARYKAVVDFTEHGFSSGAHLAKFVVQG